MARDAHVARRNIVPMMFQTFLQPLIFVFIFGRVMVGSGYMPAAYKSFLLPGIMAISMVFTGVWAVAMPLIAEFQWTREIEDRLLGPIDISWVAIEKVVAGTFQALVAGLVVFPSGLAYSWDRVALQHSCSAVFVCVIALVVAVFRMRRPRARLQHEPATHRVDVQHGHDADDFFRMHLLSLERAEEFSYPAEGRADQPSGVCQRGIARHSGAAVSALVPLAVVIVALMFFDVLLLVVGLRRFRGKAVS